MASTETDTLKRGVFISHITAEAPVAQVLQQYVKKAYPDDFPVFVSSDNRSIPGGEDWWQHIRNSIKRSEVVLVLLSDESASREWINFEAGVGDGSGAKVVPVAIKDYRFDKLDFPLKGFQGRCSGDLEGILFAIDKATTRSAGSVDKAAYVDDLRKAEESVTYKSLLFRPMRASSVGNHQLLFELENRGNVDVDLLFAEIRIPRDVLDLNSPTLASHPTVEIDSDGQDCVIRYWVSESRDSRRLWPTITRSMGVRRLNLRFRLKGNLSASDLAAVIRYQIHGRNIDTQPEEMVLILLLTQDETNDPRPSGQAFKRLGICRQSREACFKLIKNCLH